MGEADRLPGVTARPRVHRPQVHVRRRRRRRRSSRRARSTALRGRRRGRAPPPPAGRRVRGRVQRLAPQRAAGAAGGRRSPVERAPAVGCELRVEALRRRGDASRRGEPAGGGHGPDLLVPSAARDARRATRPPSADHDGSRWPPAGWPIRVSSFRSVPSRRTDHSTDCAAMPSGVRRERRGLAVRRPGGVGAELDHLPRRAAGRGHDPDAAPAREWNAIHWPSGDQSGWMFCIAVAGDRRSRGRRGRARRCRSPRRPCGPRRRPRCARRATARARCSLRCAWSRAAAGRRRAPVRACAGRGAATPTTRRRGPQRRRPATATRTGPSARRGARGGPRAPPPRRPRPAPPSDGADGHGGDEAIPAPRTVSM